MSGASIDNIREESVRWYANYLRMIKCPERCIEEEIIKQATEIFDYSGPNYSKRSTGIYRIDIESGTIALDKTANIISDNTLHLLKNIASSPSLSYEELLDRILDKKTFEQAEPTMPKEPEYPNDSEYDYPKAPVYPMEPKIDDVKYLVPKTSFFQRIINKNSVLEQQNRLSILYKKDHEEWKHEVENIRNDYNEALAAIRRKHEQDVSKSKLEYKEALDTYEKSMRTYADRKNSFYLEQEISNKRKIDLITSASEGDEDSVSKVYTWIISLIELPFEFSFEGETEYHHDEGVLLIDVILPTQEQLPNIKSVKWVKSRSEVKISEQSDTFMRNYYDTVIYQMVLLLIHRCFSHSIHIALPSKIVLNGYVRTVDPATGKSVSPCILSVSVKRESYNDLVLNAIDAKAWFKESNGVAAAKLSKITPIPPIQKLDKTDSRFVDGYNVINEIDEGMNIAAMDWQDFENLVRELFEEELSSNGGEVMLTQPSRDGGVDAVAFDPDPIRGGKIVIQAKRYTNVVGVSAVRDLYGTVVNEGAIKGILVTTSGYGNDAYEFAKNKPISLLDGGNLLALLERHGHKARINIEEARKLKG